MWHFRLYQIDQKIINRIVINKISIGSLYYYLDIMICLQHDLKCRLSYIYTCNSCHMYLGCMDVFVFRGQTRWLQELVILWETSWTCRLQDLGAHCSSKMWSSPMRWRTLTGRESQREWCTPKGQVSVEPGAVTSLQPALCHICGWLTLHNKGTVVRFCIFT